ncbi:MAG: hypothetical protein IPL08_07005 [Saprospiraceae bacterium]|nr:hypothetical protein [Saprospiraceae bacterium]
MSLSWDEFKKYNRNEWMQKAESDLKGKYDLNQLNYHIGKDISISSFITASEVTEVTEVINGPISKSGVSIKAHTTEEANLKALQMLNMGAEALSFDVNADVNFEVLFKDIFLDMVRVVLNFTGTHNTRIKEKLSIYLNSFYNDKDTDIILINTETLDLAYGETHAERIRKAKSFYSANVDSQNDVILRVALKKDFFAQISELRAIRLIHTQETATSTLIILAYIDEESIRGEEVSPLIVCNYLLMSAYFGMCDVVFGIPYADDGETARLSLNMQHIFKEESYLDSVTDPMAGSYVVTSLTKALMEII